MYSELKFKDYISPVRTLDVNKALDMAKDLTVSPIKTSFETIQISPEGEITFTKEVKDSKSVETRPMTRYAFEKLYKMLGISFIFATRIPIDLLLMNIHRLLKDYGSENLILLERNDGTIAGVVRKQYEEIPYLDVLSCFADKESVQYIDIGELMLTICLGFKDTEFKDPKAPPGDFYLMAGSHVYSSIVKEVPLYLSSSLYRSFCSNSFVMPFLGKARADYRLKPEERILEFSKNVQYYDEKVWEILKNNFEGVEERRLFEHEISMLFKKLQKFVGNSSMDRFIGTNEEERKLIIDRADTWKEQNKRNKILRKPLDEPVLTKYLAYDVLNEITNFAASNHESSKRSIETIAGNILGSILLGGLN